MKKITTDFLDIITNIDLYNKVRDRYLNYSICDFKLKDKINIGYTKDTKDYVYGDYGKLSENKGDLFMVTTIPESININPKTIKGLNRYTLSVRHALNDETYTVIMLYQKYKTRPKIKFYTQTNIFTILNRDNIINNILDEH